MGRKKIAAAAAVVIIVALLGWLWFLGAEAKDICTEENNLNKVIPIAFLAMASQKGLIDEANFPAACHDGAADYVLCLEQIGLDESLTQTCVSSQQKMQSFRANICAANEIVVGIDKVSTFFAPEVCEVVEIEGSPYGSATFCGREGSLNLFGEMEAQEALALCMEAITDYLETAG